MQRAVPSPRPSPSDDLPGDELHVGSNTGGGELDFSRVTSTVVQQSLGTSLEPMLYHNFELSNLKSAFKESFSEVLKINTPNW